MKQIELNTQKVRRKIYYLKKYYVVLHTILENYGLREYMKVKSQKFCEVMKILRERSYENFYNPPSSDGGGIVRTGRTRDK